VFASFPLIAIQVNASTVATPIAGYIRPTEELSRVITRVVYVHCGRWLCRVCWAHVRAIPRWWTVIIPACWNLAPKHTRAVEVGF